MMDACTSNALEFIVFQDIKSKIYVEWSHPCHGNIRKSIREWHSGCTFINQQQQLEQGV